MRSRWWKDPAVRRLIVEVLVIYIIPVIIVKFIGIRRSFHGFMAFFVFWSVAVAIYGRLGGISFREMGFTCEKLGRSLVVNLLLMLLAIAVILLLGGDRLLTHPHLSRSVWFPLFYVFLSCPAQELLYRGLSFGLMERAGVRNGAVLVIVSSFLYMFLHILFSKPLILPLTFAAGIAWGVVYWRVRNLWGVMLSHALAGMLAIMAGLA